ncbi:heat-stable enterotoxin receptor [Gadus morhua]|uniref:Guanylate cyclase n=1 Tax=Gadus morhua TaxID=8049 RepID=A0A8C4ZG72_GADMO|nr:heat-stable enterotoxin receptor-like [Gadus morhua]
MDVRLCLIMSTLNLVFGDSQKIQHCKNGSLINVVLLNDNESPWSMKFVKGKVLEAIELNSQINAAADVSQNVTALFSPFDSRLYRMKGCGSSTCGGVEAVKRLNDSGQVGCALLGPSCNYAVFQMVDTESGLQLSMPIISAGGFSLSCDHKPNLQRVLPPARKVSNFFTEFWKFNHKVKPEWDSAYVYKKKVNTEDCFWYIEALEASTADFFRDVHLHVLRKPWELQSTLRNPQNRTSNLFIACGSPADMQEMKNNTAEANSKDILFLLIDLYNDEYYRNATSLPFMENVLVLTMPDVRHYKVDMDLSDNTTVMNDYMAAYHDSVLLVGEVMRKIWGELGEGSDMQSINHSYFRNITFNGIGGTYKLDEHGDRDVNFSVIYTTETKKYGTLFAFNTVYNITKLNTSNPTFIWGNKLPYATPYRVMSTKHIVLIVLSVTVVVVATIAFIFYRQNRRERRTRKRWSHIPSDRITLMEQKEHNVISLKIDDERKETNYKIRCGRYDKKVVILKELKHSDGNFDEPQRIELNSMLLIDYYNLTKFYGTVQLEQGVFAVLEYGERGSLRYVLNDKVSYPEGTFMDWEFKISVMYDISKGMSYLHASNIQVHGRLKSTNCVVDNRMVVKITDFGCNTILSPGRDLWTAPEHLRQEGISQKGDVYSFSIIAQEIVLRKSTFYTERCSDRAEKLSRLQDPDSISYFRPDLNFETASEKELEVYRLIKTCWEEDPEKRPDFKKVENCFGKIFSNLHSKDNESYMDNLIRRLQMYSKNLELLVEERTALYKAERDRADYLNYMLLPGPVVKSLKETGVVEPELYDEVTVYFSDVVGFTTLCQYSTPMEVVDMLSDIYRGFDSVLDHHDVYKVETIGDAYMVASGLPRRNGNRHAVDICRMALDILAFMGSFQLRHLPGIPVWIRIGVHSGSCAAGVVGMKMPRYCLFGDTVNTASRMESTGHPLRIHVSEPTVKILGRTGCQFEFEARGETVLKGKGTESTYWLTGEKGKDYDLPTPPTTENFQRLRQHLAQMILECVERRSVGSIRKRAPRPQRQIKMEQEGDHYQPEYLHLATVENTLSTFL